MPVPQVEILFAFSARESWHMFMGTQQGHQGYLAYFRDF